MTEIIKNQYADLIVNSADFRLFVESMSKISTNEIKVKYGLKNDIISYCSGLLKMQA